MNQFTVAQLIELIQNSHKTFRSFVMSLDKEQQQTVITHDNWKVKDVMAHLTAWQRGILFLLQQQSRLKGMYLSESLRQTWDTDLLNDKIFNQSKDMPFEEILGEFDSVNGQIIEVISNMSVEDLLKPYKTYDSQVDFEEPVVKWIHGNTHGHFNEHLEKLKTKITNT